MRVQWRQGDVLVEQTDRLPDNAAARDGDVLFVGERSGHAHRIEPSAGAEIFESRGQLFLRTTERTRIVHDEHGPIDLEPGLYRVWRQREYIDGRGRPIAD